MPRERKIVEMRFGFGDYDPHTFDELSYEFDVTRERIRQILAKALVKIQCMDGFNKVKDYIT